MLIRGGSFFGEDNQFRAGSLVISGDRILAAGADADTAAATNAAAAAETAGGEVFDATGYRIIPGLIDIHTHGCVGRDFCDGQPGALDVMGRYLASQGVTSFAPASMALPENELSVTFRQAVQYRSQMKPDQTSLAGIYMEGPFFAKSKKGAHREECIIPIDAALFARLDAISGHLVKVVCLAPETPGSMAFIAAVKNRCTVSIAHTAADYDTAAASFQAGATQVTHLFNAMNPFGHRQPGVPGAAFDCPSVFVELISDGLHLHPAVIRAAFRLYGAGRVILVSDAMSACGMPDGEYALGGQQVFVNSGAARLADGTIAGSTTNLMAALRCAVNFGIPLTDALQAVTINPARAIREESRIGSLAAGRQADLVVLDDQLRIIRVMLRGQWLKGN